jgi:hypothetical protein
LKASPFTPPPLPCAGVVECCQGGAGVFPAAPSAPGAAGGAAVGSRAAEGGGEGEKEGGLCHLICIRGFMSWLGLWSGGGGGRQGGGEVKGQAESLCQVTFIQCPIATSGVVRCLPCGTAAWQSAQQDCKHVTHSLDTLSLTHSLNKASTHSMTCRWHCMRASWCQSHAQAAWSCRHNCWRYAQS